MIKKIKRVEDIRDLGDALGALEYLKIVKGMSMEVCYVICTYPQYAYLEQAQTPQERKYYGEGDVYQSLGLNIDGKIIIRCRPDPE